MPAGLKQRSGRPANSGLKQRSGRPTKMRKTADLPSKLCLACGLPFAWRKKWERDWDNVKYCSDRCRRNKGAPC